MKMFLNTASPYARLIRVLLVETALEDRTELVFTDPWDAPPELLAANPAAKIPALALGDGTYLVESACIADYLILRSVGWRRSRPWLTRTRPQGWRYSASPAPPSTAPSAPSSSSASRPARR